MKNLLDPRFLFLLLNFSLLSFKGCFTKEKEEVVVDQVKEALKSIEAFEVQSTTVGPLSYYLHKSGKDNIGAICRVTKEEIAEGPKDLLCWLEAEELDLNFYGNDLRVLVPPGICDYVTTHLYYIWGWQPGQTSESYSTHNNDDCDTCNGGACSGSQVQPACAFDYSGSSGPNCDIGSRTETVYSYTNNDGICVTENVETTVHSCGELENLSDCLRGPGVESDFRGPNGFPIGEIIYGLDGVDKSYRIEDAGLRRNNLYYSNYLTGCASGTYTYEKDNLILYTRNNPLTDRAADPFKQFVVLPNPYHAFTCYDKAREIKARILVQVREWDVQYSITEDGIDQTDPPKLNVSGDEPDYIAEPFNDYTAWDNWISGNPDCANDVNSYGYRFPTVLLDEN